jgi:hypothetical protein
MSVALIIAAAALSGVTIVSDSKPLISQLSDRILVQNLVQGVK